ncbi:WEB family protein At2g17940 [Malania oleifera]|uniref:WEB family protein At2g17940 n=1 Tax=Malania oleifera TaxID=397392 RepID=UPI0025AE814D|nr:WEB family protein At2g17940 [Malania oleifera]
MERSEEGVVVIGRAEIDTRAPFRSVKEAVLLFGERVLVGEVYAQKLKEMRTTSESGNVQSKIQTVTTELEETKQSLQKAREEGILMANCLKSLKDELQQTKTELRQLKAIRELEKETAIMDPEIEELKFIENAPSKAQTKVEVEESDIQKKRYVTFASPPSLAQVIINHDHESEAPMQKKDKKKPIVPIIGRMFSKKHGSNKRQSPRVGGP